MAGTHTQRQWVIKIWDMWAANQPQAAGEASNSAAQIKLAVTGEASVKITHEDQTFAKFEDPTCFQITGVITVEILISRIAVNTCSLIYKTNPNTLPHL